MDRIILHFQQDEPDDDFNTACRVISPQNIIETELLLLVLKRAATEHFNDTKANAQTLLAVSMKLIKSKRPKQAADGLHLVSKIIYRNPTDSTVFLDAILARSLQMMRTQKYPLTRNDLRYYKSFPVHNMTPEGLVLVQTLLCSALYYTREMSEARAELFQLETGLQILSDQIIRENQELYTFLMHLERYKKEIREPSKNVHFRRKPKAVPYFPLRGFNLDRKIPAASHLCEYICEEGERGVYARKYIPAKSIVIVESGENFQFSAPFMNCEMCGAYEENLYTCSECRSKCYCSNACLKYDWEEHQHECYGYRIGIIPMFEAKMLFRFFVQAAKCLSPALAAYTLQNGPIRNASVAWDFIIESARSYNREARTIGEFLCRQPNMNLFTPAKWRQLVTIALRLAVFVYNDSNIPETFFDTLKLTKNDSIILYTTIFLRLSTHIVLNSQQNEMEYHYEIPAEDPVPDPQPQAMQRMNMNAFAFFSIYAHTDFVNSFRRVENRIQHIREWKPFEGLFANTKRLPTDVGSPMYEFCTKLLNVVIRKKEIRVFNDLYNSDNALSPVEIEKYFENLNTSDRCTILEEFARLFQQHMYDYFRNEKRQEKTALCVTMKKVAHACDANTEIRALRDGTYLAVTKKSLRPGTQLTISQSSVSHLSMSRAERRAYFQAIGTSCDCKACTGHPLLEPTNVRQAIFCAYCLTEVEITPLHGNCRQCNSNYHQFMQNYSKFVSCALEEIHFREKHRRTTQRELSCLYGMYHSYVTMHYAKGHEIRLSAVIIFVEHLIKKGFINHACDMIFALLDIDFSMNTPLTRKEIEKKIFNLLRRVTQCYIDSFLNCDAMAVDTSYPKMLLYALKYMLRVQEKDFELAIDDREEYNTHLAHYTEYYKWKIIINSNLTMPLVLQRYLTEN